MKYDLTQDEIEILKRSIGASDPFDTVKYAEVALAQAEKRVSSANEELIEAKNRLSTLQDREKSIEILRNKLGSK